MTRHRLKQIRDRLGVTQQVMAAALGCSQGNVANYERGQTMPPETAGKLISFAASKGLAVGYDHVYGNALLPEAHEVANA